MNKDQQIAALEQKISVYEGNMFNAQAVMKNQGDKIASLTRSIVTLQGIYNELLQAADDLTEYSLDSEKGHAAAMTVIEHLETHNE